MPAISLAETANPKTEGVPAGLHCKRLSDSTHSRGVECLINSQQWSNTNTAIPKSIYCTLATHVQTYRCMHTGVCVLCTIMQVHVALLAFVHYRDQGEVYSSHAPNVQLHMFVYPSRMPGCTTSIIVRTHMYLLVHVYMEQDDVSP